MGELYLQSRIFHAVLFNLYVKVVVLMRFGCMLEYDIFVGEISETSRKLCDSFGGRTELLKFLGDNVNTVEISMMDTTEDMDGALKAAKVCAEYGLKITIHGVLKEDDTPKSFFEPYVSLFGSNMQDEYSITIHPLNLKEDSISKLREICEYADKNNYPVRIRLENQRFVSEYSINGSCRSVAEIVNAVAHDKLSACLDFGHLLSNRRNFGEESDPCEADFMSLVQHTHIHSMYDGVTHFPLDHGETELERNITELISHNYQGILSLELGPERYKNIFEFKSSFVNSVSVLKTAYSQIINKIDMNNKYKNYGKHIDNIFKSSKDSSCGIGQIGTAAYIMKIGNTKLAIDPALWGLDIDECCRKRVIDELGDCDAIIYSHQHGDHFDENVIKEIFSEKTKFLIPDFIINEVGDDYVNTKENLVVTERGKSYYINDVKITVFNSIHVASHIESFQSSGDAIEYDGKTYVFPGDVRQYIISEYPKFENTKAVIAHLWLGSTDALNVYDNPYIDEFVEFMNSFGAERTLLGHMYDVRRTIDQMWGDVHFDAVSDRLNSPEILKLGTWIEL